MQVLLNIFTRHGQRRSLAYVLLLFAVLLEGACGWSVLVLGGTGFRGHPTTERLIREGHNVTTISRGRPYWGFLDEVKGRITHWKCNRTIKKVAGLPQKQSSGLASCAQLVNETSFFDAVVDFSSKHAGELEQAVAVLKGRVGVYIFISTHGVYDVAKNATHGDPLLLETDAVRPGKEISPLERYQLKATNDYGDAALEGEEELMKQFNAGGFPFVVFRLGNVIGPKENTIRYWLLHLWLRAHLPLTMPMHLDQSMLELPISLTYTPDIAQAVVRAIAKSRGDVCCPEDVHAEAFNLACEEAPNQRTLYNYIAEPIGLPYVETIETNHNKSIVLYPEIVRGPLSHRKALDRLGWTPTVLTKALRSVARFYDRVMIEGQKYRQERSIIYAKCKKMIADDGQRFVEWLRAYYAERAKTELYDEIDDEDEDDIVLSRPNPEKRPRRRSRRARRSSSASKAEL